MFNGKNPARDYGISCLLAYVFVATRYPSFAIAELVVSTLVLGFGVLLAGMAARVVWNVLAEKTAGPT